MKWVCVHDFSAHANVVLAMHLPRSFLDAAELTEKQPAAEALFDGVLATAYRSLVAHEGMRVAAGAGAGTRANPSGSLADYEPPSGNQGGLLDDMNRSRVPLAAATAARR
jgi:hypothetical protein